MKPGNKQLKRIGIDDFEAALQVAEKREMLRAAEIAKKEIIILPTEQWVRENPDKAFTISARDYHKQIAKAIETEAEKLGKGR